MLARLLVERLLRLQHVATRSPGMRRSTRHLAVREVTGSRPAVGGRLLELVRGGLVEPRSLLVTLVHEPTLASYVSPSQ